MPIYRSIRSISEMVKSVKRCLHKTIGRGRLTLDELQMAVTEVEMIVNSRPLSYLSTESIQEPITPSHLLTGRRVMSLPDGPYNNELHEDNRPRGFWKLAKVESLITGTDGLTRGAAVRVHSSDKRCTLLRRPLQLLYPLKVHQCCDAVGDCVSNSSSAPPETEQSESTEVDVSNSANGDQPNPTQGPHR